jgi:hypothetical protein
MNLRIKKRNGRKRKSSISERISSAGKENRK